MTIAPLNRRGLLTTLGKAFGAGGLLLSGSRPGAMALPLEMGPAAELPVTVSKLPVSSDLVRWRAMMDELHEMRINDRIVPVAPFAGPLDNSWSQLYGSSDKVAERISGRSKPTWADCVELAEICWRTLPKEEAPSPLGPGYVGKPTGRLSRDPKQVGSKVYHCTDPVVALVEAVLALGGGERRDPNTDQGRF